MRQEIKYILQYVNMRDGTTHYHCQQFDYRYEFEDFIATTHGEDWSSYEIIVVKR